MKKNIMKKVGTFALATMLVASMGSGPVSAQRIKTNMDFGDSTTKITAAAVIDVRLTSVAAEISTTSRQLLYAQAIGSYTYGGVTKLCKNNTNNSSATTMVGCTVVPSNNGYYFAEGRGRYRVSTFAYQYGSWKTPYSTK